MTDQTTPPDDSAMLAEVLAEVRRLSAQVADLEARLTVQEKAEEITPDIVLAISAAVAAFLGHKAKIKHIHYRQGQAWAQQGRVAIQGRHSDMANRHR